MNVTLPMTPILHTPIQAKTPVIKVVGLGGGGQNAVDRMIELGLCGVEFIAANTDAQVLHASQADIRIQLGPILTRGLGAGGNPEIGEAAAQESEAVLRDALAGADMVFLTAGMGGGTGTGAISVTARLAKELGAVVIGVVSLPFSFEVGRRQKNAREGLAKLQPFTDTLISVPNDRLLQCAPPDVPLEMAFRMADDVLRQGVQGISELITQSGLINVDFAHVRATMKNGGGSLLAIGTSQGEDKAMKALEQALHHPMLETVNLEDARGIIANFTGGSDLSFGEVTDALRYLQLRTSPETEIIPGVLCDEIMEDRVQVILVLTGIGATSVDSPRPAIEEVQPEPVIIEKIQPEISPIPETLASAGLEGMEFSQDPNDLDIPAFLRRKVR